MGGDDGGACRRERQQVGWNCEVGPETLDSYGMAEGLRIPKVGRGHGIEDRPVYRG